MRLCLGLICAVFLFAVAGSSHAQVAPSTAELPAPYAAASAPRLRLSPHGYEEIRRLIHARPSLAGPIKLTVTGFVLLKAGLFVIGLAYAVNNMFTNEGLDKETRQTLIPFFATAGIGLSLTLGGVIWLVRTVRARQPFNERIREIARPTY
jgi:hypothetical protein